MFSFLSQFVPKRHNAAVEDEDDFADALAGAPYVPPAPLVATEPDPAQAVQGAVEAEPADRDPRTPEQRAIDAELEEQKRLAEQRLAERQERMRLEEEAHAAERDRRDEERREARRLDDERREAERIENEKRSEAERIENEKRSEAERVEAEQRSEAERIENEQREAQRDIERAEEERIAAVIAESARAERERLEAERADAERAEAERAESERRAAEERERAVAEHAELDRLAAARELAPVPVDGHFASNGVATAYAPPAPAPAPAAREANVAPVLSIVPALQRSAAIARQTWPSTLLDHDATMQYGEAARRNLLAMIVELHDAKLIAVLFDALYEESPDHLRPDILAALRRSYHGENLRETYERFARIGNEREREIARDGLRALDAAAP